MILVLTLLFLALMSVMAIGLLSAALSENQTASANRANLQALYFADAGIEEAKMRLTPGPNAITITPATNWRVYILSGHTQAEVPTLDPTYGKAPPDYTATETTSNYSFTQTIQTGANPVAWGWARIQVRVLPGGGIDYNDALTPGRETASATQVVNSTDPQCSGGVTIRNTPLVTVTSEGLVGKVRRQVESTLFPTGTPATVNCLPTETFQMALHASGAITMNGHYTIDSHNSSHGTYAQTKGRARR